MIHRLAILGATGDLTARYLIYSPFISMTPTLFSKQPQLAEQSRRQLVYSPAAPWSGILIASVLLLFSKTPHFTYGAFRNTDSAYQLPSNPVMSGDISPMNSDSSS
jgi:hypothetical protein